MMYTTVFQFDFYTQSDDSLLRAAGEDGKVNVFKVPAGGLTQTIVQTEACLRGWFDHFSFVTFPVFMTSITATTISPVFVSH